MLKKILLVALLFLPFGAFAQDKIAYCNSSEVILNMPEYKQMQDSLKITQEAIKADIATMEEEYSRKYEAFMKEGENLIETIKIRRMQEIRDLEQRAATYNEQSQQMLQQLYEQLLLPIQQKVKDAIQAVGAENNFLYIVDAATLLYVNPSASNATDLVKKKLDL
ncbi:MAG: OmpH family outer membrane protein [Candidatus Symbiothrix sp.]|jgi:outer membrane protein|nr:OmpH family outer membrane protein [Candidatus Symbiothrix sp.]